MRRGEVCKSGRESSKSRSKFHSWREAEKSRRGASKPSTGERRFAQSRPASLTAGESRSKPASLVESQQAEKPRSLAEKPARLLRARKDSHSPVQDLVNDP